MAVRLVERITFLSSSVFASADITELEQKVLIGDLCSVIVPPPQAVTVIAAGYFHS